jgi:hypothetical protein
VTNSIAALRRVSFPLVSQMLCALMVGNLLAYETGYYAADVRRLGVGILLLTVFLLTIRYWTC